MRLASHWVGHPGIGDRIVACCVSVNAPTSDRDYLHGLAHRNTASNCEETVAAMPSCWRHGVRFDLIEPQIHRTLTDAIATPQHNKAAHRFYVRAKSRRKIFALKCHNNLFKLLVSWRMQANEKIGGEMQKGNQENAKKYVLLSIQIQFALKVIVTLF